MVVKSVFSLSLARAVRDVALSTKLRSRTDPVLGTFAFYVKGRRASPPAERMTPQIEAQPGKLRPTSPSKAQKSQTDGSSKSTSLPIIQASQTKDDSPNFQVLLVEDNLVNRQRLQSPFNQLALTVD